MRVSEYVSESEWVIEVLVFHQRKRHRHLEFSSQFKNKSYQFKNNYFAET